MNRFANRAAIHRTAAILGDPKRAYAVALDVTGRAGVNAMMAEAAAR